MKGIFHIQKCQQKRQKENRSTISFNPFIDGGGYFLADRRLSDYVYYCCVVCVLLTGGIFGNPFNVATAKKGIFVVFCALFRKGSMNRLTASKQD